MERIQGHDLFVCIENSHAVSSDQDQFRMIDFVFAPIARAKTEGPEPTANTLTNPI
jgi:hypothetical protein